MASQTVNLRNLIIPSKKGWCFVDCDWAQVENRIGAILTGETFLLDAFARGEDIYKKVYAEMFKVKIDTVTKSQRQIGKQLVLGQNYDMTYVGLAKALKCAEAEAKEFIIQYEKAHPRTQAAKRELMSFARQNGFVRTFYGRIRYVNNINSDNDYMRQAAEREVWNTYIQGTAADILKISLKRLDSLFKKEEIAARIVIPVHDEILAECSVEADPWVVRNLMKQAMEIELKGYKLPVEAEFGWRWGELFTKFDKFVDSSPVEYKDILKKSSFYSQPVPVVNAVSVDVPAVEVEPESDPEYGSDELVRVVESDYQYPCFVWHLNSTTELTSSFVFDLEKHKCSTGYCLYVYIDDKEMFKLPSRVGPAVKILLDQFGTVDVLSERGVL